jgi:lipoprotein-releasing system permease protein
VDPDAPKAVADLDKYLFEAKATDLKPSMMSKNGRKERIFLGRELSRRLGVGLGDDVILFLPILQQTPLGMMPMSRKFQVVGIFSTGMYDYDASFAYTSLDIAKTMIFPGEGSTGGRSRWTTWTGRLRWRRRSARLSRAATWCRTGSR